MSNEKEYNIPYEMPYITKMAIEYLSPYGWSEESLDVTYSMAREELGFNPSMVNKGNVGLMALEMYFDNLATERENPLMERVGKKLYNIHWGINKELDTSPEDSKKREWSFNWMDGTELGDYSIEDLKDDILDIDEKYNIYNNEGLNVINEILDRSLVNRDTLRSLYWDKYEEQWSK